MFPAESHAMVIVAYNSYLSVASDNNKKKLADTIGNSNCHCDQCKELSRKYWKPKPGKYEKLNNE